LSKKKIFYLQGIHIFLLGLITSFSLPPYNYWILNFFTLSLLIIFLYKQRDKSFKNFFIYGFIFGFSFFVSSLYWIPFSLSYDENFKYLIPFAIVIIPSFLSLFYSFAFVIFRYFLKRELIFSNILIFSLIFSFFEYLRGNILSGFPWNFFAYSFSENLNLIQINSLIGVYAFNMISITIFCAPSILYLNRNKINIIGFFIILITFISFYTYGVIKIKNFDNLNSQTLPFDIKVLSTTIPIERFYSTLDNEEVLIKLIDLSKPEFNKNTIFIWPEGIVPNINLISLSKEYSFLFQKSFSKNHIIILGINDEENIDGNQKYYNSMSVIDNNADVLFKYHKNKLVPFGEFIPFENFLSKIGLKSLTNNYQSYSSSKERKLFVLDKNMQIKILPLICYEIIYSGNLTNKHDYNFIVNISEDGWFGNSIGPYQHYAHAVFRSIEQGKYVLRSANNGITAIINPLGLAVDKINIKNEGTISINEIKSLDKTLFSMLGNKIYFLIILLYIFLIFSFNRSKNE